MKDFRKQAVQSMADLILVKKGLQTIYDSAYQVAQRMCIKFENYDVLNGTVINDAIDTIEDHSNELFKTRTVLSEIQKIAHDDYHSGMKIARIQLLIANIDEEETQ